MKWMVDLIYHSGMLYELVQWVMGLILGDNSTWESPITYSELYTEIIAKAYS